jgi:hypothetical protein
MLPLRKPSPAAKVPPHSVPGLPVAIAVYDVMRSSRVGAMSHLLQCPQSHSELQCTGGPAGALGTAEGERVLLEWGGSSDGL